jgi:hypothetical protein
MRHPVQADPFRQSVVAVPLQVGSALLQACCQVQGTAGGSTSTTFHATATTAVIRVIFSRIDSS